MWYPFFSLPKGVGPSAFTKEKNVEILKRLNRAQTSTSLPAAITRADDGDPWSGYLPPRSEPTPSHLLLLYRSTAIYSHASYRIEYKVFSSLYRLFTTRWTNTCNLDERGIISGRFVISSPAGLHSDQIISRISSMHSCILILFLDDGYGYCRIFRG